MTKVAEQRYLSMIGEDGRQHSLGKPFSDPYCGMNLASIGFIMSLLPEPPARVLDMGCGGGWTSIFYARRGYQVVAQDIAEDMIVLARENVDRQGVGDQVSLVCCDFEDSGFEAEFDAVIFFDCLHHADDERAALASAYRALKPGGIVITHEPGEGHSTAPGSIEAMRIFGVNERDMPPRLIIRQGREIGFRSAKILPLPHDLIELLYKSPMHKRFRKAWRVRAERLYRLAFRPDDRAGAIVVMMK